MTKLPLFHLLKSFFPHLLFSATLIPFFFIVLFPSSSNSYCNSNSHFAFSSTPIALLKSPTLTKPRIIAFHEAAFLNDISSNTFFASTTSPAVTYPTTIAVQLQQQIPTTSPAVIIPTIDLHPPFTTSNST